MKPDLLSRAGAVYDTIKASIASFRHPDLFMLLGAGASVPGMLSTADITTKLKAWSRFREPPAAGFAAHPSGPLDPAGATDTRANLFEAISKVVTLALKTPGDAATFLHFERLVHIAELLGSTFPLPPANRENEFRFLLGTLLTTAPETAHWNIDGVNYTVAAHEACYEILDWFKAQCDALDAGAHPQARGLKELGRRNTLRLFSLNYDDIAVASGLTLYTGFEDRRFRPKYPWPRGQHTLCQLHGSVLFGIGDESDAFEVIRLPKRDTAARARLARGSGPRFMDGHMGGNAPMITGLRKADKTMARPFGTYMHVMRDELLRCPRWLIVGYGFADTHVNEAMRQARANWKARGREVRAVIVNYHRPLRDDSGEPLLDAWPGMPAADALESACGSVFIDALADFHHARKLPKLDRSMFTELTRHVAVHFGGTEAALVTDLAKVEAFLNR